MIRTIGTLLFACLFATAAHATVTTIEYDLGEGEKVTIAYDDATNLATSQADGAAASSPYTWDEATSTVCSTDGEGNEVCATFENAGTEAGHTTSFTTNDGRAGTATIVSVE